MAEVLAREMFSLYTAKLGFAANQASCGVYGKLKFGPDIFYKMPRSARMFEFLKGKKPKETQLEDKSSGSVDVEALPDIFKFFPIGDKIQYFPEYNRDELFDSIVIGYEINRQFLYTMTDFALDEFDKSEVHFFAADGKASIVRIDSFGLLIPDNRRSELQVGHRTGKGRGRLVAEESRDFRTGNNVTLVSPHPGRGAPHLDTTVGRSILLKKGYYANHSVVLLRPVYDSLVQIDRRSNQRIETNLPVDVRLAGGVVFACRLMDVGEGTVRIEVPISSDLMAKVHLSDKLSIQLSLQEPPRDFHVEALITKILDRAFVIRLMMTDKYGRFVDLGLIDLLDIKATILKQPQSRK